MDLALLILRLTVGVVLMAHGAQKLFGWFGGSGLTGVAGWLTSMGFRPARLWAWLVAIVEFFGGLLLALGLFSPLGSIGIGSSMLMAITRAHWPKFIAQGGFEFPLVNLAVAIAVGLTGPGAYSLDASLGTALPATLSLLLVLGALVVWLIGLITSTSQRAQVAGGASR